MNIATPKFLSVLLLGIALSIQSAFAASGMFPKMPAATNVYVVDIHQDSGDARKTAWALQGLVNQSSAEVYIANQWQHLEQLKDSGKPFEKLQELSGTDAGLRTLFQQYQGRVKKMFIYDPDKDWTWYLALMSGAQQEGIPVTASVRDELISEFGWTGEVEDFRNRWANRIEAYDWALTNLMPNCSKQVVFAPRTGMPIIDYAAASRGFAFWLDFSKPDELAEVRKIFQTTGYGVGTSLMGYASGGDKANEIANRYGIGYVVSDRYANGSFWSSFPDKIYTQSRGKAIKAEPGKIYAHIMWSDGDNIQFDQNPLYNFWHDSARGTIPVATELSPTLQELNSPLLDWYYSQMTTNDELVAGPTGVQYIFIRDYNDGLFPAWCRLTHDWCEDAGFHSTRIWLADKGTAKYFTYMHLCGFDGLLGEGWSVAGGFPPQIDTWGAANEEDLYNHFLAVKPNPQAPVFCGFTCIVQGFNRGGHGYSAVRRQIDRVEKEYPGRYVFLLPKDEFATIQAYYNTNTLQISGRPGITNGLSPVSAGDSDFTVTKQSGVNCWLLPKHTSPNYLYLDVDDHFLVQPGARLELDLAYLDTGSGDIVLDYDSTDFRLPNAGAYKEYPYAIHRQNSGQWKLARFYVNDAHFANRENGGADFRFYNGGDDLLISAVQVRRK
jgi:hypothetical protein